MTDPIRSVGIIMDGNRRWAKARGRTSLEGHRAGLDRIRELAREFHIVREKYGVEFITLYAFSTENWNRSPEEVAYLMKLFEEGMRELLEGTNDTHGPRIRAIGQRARFADSLRKLLDDVEEKTAHRTGGTVTFALSYGGHAEIVDAANAAIKTGTPVTKETFEKLLWSADVPDPDIIIRTGGEQRLSNFLLWKSAYAELFFPKVMWPDFTLEELEKIFEEYRARERRHGK